MSNIFKKIAGYISVLGLSAGILGTPVYATAPKNPAVPAVNTITLVKLEYQNEAPPIQNTGLPIPNLPAEVKPYDRTKYGDVEFTLYKLNKALIPQNANPSETAEAVQNAVLAPSALPYGAVKQGNPAAVDNNGIAVFTNVPSNNDDVYVIVETKKPATVVTRAKPMLLQLPITNAQGTGYLTGVTLYPKNEVKPIEIVFTKHGATAVGITTIPGAKFALYEGSKGQGQPIKDETGNPLVYTTDSRGGFKITDIPPGKYYLVEQQSAGIVDGMTEKATPYQARDFIYLAGYDAMNSKNNMLGFEIAQDRTITWDDGYKDFDYVYVNSMKPAIEKFILNPYVSIRGRMADPGTPNFDRYEDMNFQILVDLPQNIKDYSDFSITDTLVYEDKPSDVLRFKDNITVKVATKGTSPEEFTETLANGTDYVLSKTENNNFKIQFAIDGKVSAKVAGLAENRQNEILIEYSGEFYGENILSGAAYENRADFSYNNSPDGSTETRYDTHSTQFTTYNFYLKKTNDGLWSSGIVKSGLQGAQFVLIRDAYNVTDSEGNDVTESQYFAGVDASGDPLWKTTGVGLEEPLTDTAISAIAQDMLTNHTNALFTSDKNGIVEIKSFRTSGSVTYSVIEVKAPEGYRLPTGNRQIPLISTGETDGLNTIDTAQEIVNFRSPDLPVTGSEKTVIILASVLAFFTITLILRHKNSTKTMKK